MPDVPVSLTPWFDAKDNPPETSDGYLTDDGPCEFWSRPGFGWEAAFEGAEAKPEPTVWARYPSPPDMSDPLGPLTVADLRWAVEAAEYEAEAQALIGGSGGDDARGDADARATRLRRALDAIEAKP